jgi:CHASE3 domain sensor protein
MGLPTQVVSLSPEEVAELHQRLSEMRHNINNHLTLMVTALELMRRKPDSAERMVANLIDQPSRIREDVTRFSGDFEKTLHITAE